MTEEIKFPFEPSEKVKAAFRQSNALDESVALMTAALMRAAANATINPWNVIREEHPEFLSLKEELVYSHFREQIDLKVRNK